jgi:hypothetical protein
MAELANIKAGTSSSWSRQTNSTRGPARRWDTKPRPLSSPIPLHRPVESKGANLAKSDLRNVNFKNANPAGGNLEVANIQGAQLEGANLAGANTNGTVETPSNGSVNLPPDSDGSKTVAFSGNGNTGGTPPVAGSYQPGSTVTVPANTGGLVRTGYTFSGWNSSPDGDGTDYPVGSEFTMPQSGFTLCAK